MKLIFIMVGLFLTSCQTTKYVEKYSEPVRQGVWAAKDANDAGRFDLSTKYNNELTRLIPAPENRIKIETIYESDGKEVVK